MSIPGAFRKPRWLAMKKESERSLTSSSLYKASLLRWHTTIGLQARVFKRGVTWCISDSSDCKIETKDWHLDIYWNARICIVTKVPREQTRCVKELNARSFHLHRCHHRFHRHVRHHCRHRYRHHVRHHVHRLVRHHVHP